jgi:hypothetical protein
VFELVGDSAADPGGHRAVVGLGGASDLGELLGGKTDGNHLSQRRASAACGPLGALVLRMGVERVLLIRGVGSAHRSSRY